MGEQVSYVEQDFLVLGEVELFVQVFNFAFGLADEFAPNSQGNDCHLRFVSLVEPQKVPFGAFGIGENPVCPFADKPEDKLKIQVNQLHGQECEPTSWARIRDTPGG